MRNRNRILLFFVLLTTGISAQQVPVPAKDAASRSPIGERDKAKEDQIAKVFETIRTDAKLAPLARIKHRESLVQNLCTIVQTNASPKEMRGLYKTLHPESVTPELKRLASFNDLHPQYNASLERYSVAVWRITDPQTGEATYWVGIAAYPSAATEFFMNHFTDDLYYRNEWKKHIAPECRGQ
jgi:hypothetical protein